MNHLAAIALGASIITMPASIMASEIAESEPIEKLFDLNIDKPGGLAYDGELLWISDRVGGMIRGLDPSTGEEQRSLKAPGPWPSGLAFDGKILWVADQERGRLFGIDTESRLVLREILGPDGAQGLAFDGEHLWVTDGKTLQRVSTEDGTTVVSHSVPTWPDAPRPSDRPTEQLGLAYMDGFIWLSDRNQDRLYKIWPATGEVIDFIAAPGPFPSGLAIVDRKLMVADVDRGSVEAVRIDAMARIVRSNPRKAVAVLRRKIMNRGPDRLAEATVHVAVPEAGPSQILEGEPEFHPEPVGFFTDKFGQRIARFRAEDLEPGESLNVTMKVRATLFEVRYHIDPDQIGGLRDIPQAVSRDYLEDGSKYLIRHPSIARHVEAALGEEQRPYWMVRKIARYIRQRMVYEMIGGWDVAPTVIDRGSGSCSEYTFVFIAMCRAAGVPARYAGAIAIRGDDASTDRYFHRWAEVYLPGYEWVPIDVQHSDKPDTESQGRAFGTLANTFIITTRGGGGSTYLGWEYNSNANWICSGRCDVEDVHVNDWYPADRAPAMGLP